MALDSNVIHSLAIAEIWAASYFELDAKIVTRAKAVSLRASAGAAVTVTAAGVGVFIGAVYSPSVVIVPHDAPEQPTPNTFQTTFLPAGRFAEANCCFAPTTTSAKEGAILSVLG